MREKSYDVIIVGGGIAGSTLAIALVAAGATTSGLRVALVEAREFPATAFDPLKVSINDYDPRVSALTHASCEFYRQLSVWPAVQARRCCPFRAMRVWDARGSASIDFEADEIGEHELGFVVENRVLAAALLEQLVTGRRVALYDGVAVDDATISAGRATVTLADGSVLGADLLVAADGAGSPLREMMSIPVRRWDYGQDAIVCTVATEHPHQHTAWQVFTEEGPLAFLPLAAKAGGLFANGDNDTGEINPSAEQGTHLCSIVWSQTRDRAAALMSLADEEFQQALARALEKRLGKIVDVSRRHSFPLRQHHAVDYVREGFALLADAAHGLHPLAGQGLNLGIGDVRELADSVRAAVTARRSPGDLACLKRYQRARKTDNLAMLAAVESFHRLYQREVPLTLRWLRNEGMRAVDRQYWLKQRILRYAMGVTDTVQ
ncbi:MAG: UbiH/UbiF/VisC/COQ6 family ubiquinone biosynthesis hydroxylase [Pseudomonadales bacterium]